MNQVKGCKYTWITEKWLNIFHTVVFELILFWIIVLFVHIILYIYKTYYLLLFLFPHLLLFRKGCWNYWILWLEIYKCLEWGNILWKSRWSCHGNVSNSFFIPLFWLLERFKIWLFLAVDPEKTRIALETLFMEFTAVSWWKLHKVIKSISSIYL